MSQSSSVASARVPASALPASACVRPSTRSSTPASRSAPSTRGRKARRDVGVDEQRLGRVADAGALGLGVEDDALRGVEVGARVDVDVAVARRRVDDRHRRDALERRLQPLAAARDDQVDDALLGGQLGELLAPAAGDEHDRVLGHAGVGRRPRATAASTALECAAVDEPRSTIALPDFRHSAAASIVTFGRAS